MSIEAILARAFQLVLALTGAYTVALWFALIVWTFRDIESRSRSVIAQIFSTLVVVLFFLPGVLIYLILRPKETLDEAFGRSLEEEYLLQDLEDLSLCTTCRQPVRDDYAVCPHCYTELRRHCPACARLVDLTWALCPYCTTDLTRDDEEQEAPWREERPAMLPGAQALRMLHERMEVHLEHAGADDADGARPDEGPPPQTLVARETTETGSWADDTGKRAWILTRAREVFQPLTPTDATAHGHGREHAAQGQRDQHPNGHTPSDNGYAAHGHPWTTDGRDRAPAAYHQDPSAPNGHAKAGAFATAVQHVAARPEGTVEIDAGAPPTASAEDLHEPLVVTPGARDRGNADGQ